MKNIELTFKIELAINLLTELKKPIIYDDILNAFMINGINKDLAIDIYLFLPMIFCKKMLPTVNFPDNYFEQDNLGNKIKKKYSQNERYRIIEIEVDNYIKKSPNKNTILKVASISAEFNVINKFLLDGAKLEDIKLNEAIVLK